MAKGTKAGKSQPTKAGKHKIRPRAGEWGFMVRGKGKSQFQETQDRKRDSGKQ